MIKKLPITPENPIDTQTENENWRNFKNKSDERITASEHKVDDFKKQSVKINKQDKSNYNGKLVELDQKNQTLRKKMKTYVDDRTERQDKFTKDFTRSMKELD